MLFAPETTAVTAASALAAAPKPTPEQERIITDALFRERTADISPWVEYSSRLLQSIVPPLLFYRYVGWGSLALWEVFWFTAMGWRVAMGAVYRRRYPYPAMPQNQFLWRLIRHGYQLYGWFMVGIVPVFCFAVGAVEWEIAAVAGTGMVFVLAPLYAHERSEVLVSGIAMPLPLMVALLSRDTPLHYALAGLTVAMIAILTVWGMQQIGARRSEILLRLILNEEKARAEQANIAKSKFLAAASHDLRQPLHALSLFVEALKVRIQERPERGLVDNIENSVKALEGLFNSMLDISRLDAGTVVAEPIDFSLAPLLRRLDAEFGAQARAAGLEWHCATDDMAVRSDPVLLETILRNLISNAIRYTPEGEVHVVVEQTRDQVRIEVRDTGIGIDAAQQQTIYEEFTQLHNPERDRTKGLGLGLAIVKRIALLLNHPLELQSAPDEGSTFALTLPRGDLESVRAAAEKKPEAPIDPLRGISVLVIDDEQEIRQGMRLLLEQWKCRAIVAESEAAARELLGDEVPDLILADFRLQEGRSGIDAIHSVRRFLNQEIPALIVSGDTAPERLREAQEAGFLLLHKPVKPHKLRSAMAHLLRSARVAG